jgi:hypothetical protein
MPPPPSSEIALKFESHIATATVGQLYRKRLLSELMHPHPKHEHITAYLSSVGYVKDTVFLPQSPTKIPMFLNNKHRITEEAAPIFWDILTKVWKEMK